MSPKVTVACPVYNADEYLELALESLLDQSFDDYEIFISDNGSTDRTEEICRTRSRIGMTACDTSAAT